MPVKPDQDVNALRLSTSLGAQTDAHVKPGDSVTAISSSPSAKTWS